MKIAMIQLQSAKGDIDANIQKHAAFIHDAAAHGAQLALFPELSLTNYEPALAATLAIDPDDKRLDIFQSLSDQYELIIGVGAPTRQAAGICISMLIFQPDRARLCYSKRYLHEDETPYFAPGTNFPTLSVNGLAVGLAICYELSIPEHAAAAAQAGADIYLASVAKHDRGIDAANERLAAIASHYGMPVLVVNNLGPADNFVGAGRSAAWETTGQMLTSLDGQREGILFFDMKTATTHCLAATAS